MEVDPEKIVLGVIVTVAVGLGFFILWGPAERRRKPGRIGGLVNLGFTCFLNTLLQALAACPSMLEWLSEQESIAGSLVQALREVLLVLNGQHPTVFDDPYAPNDVIRTLIQKGWVISPGEQDAHELFHVIMTTLTEETTPKIAPVLSLSDALENAGATGSICVKNVRSSSSAPESTVNIMSSVRAFAVVSCPAFLPSLCTTPPFQGLLTSQLQCTACSYKSAVKYDKFDSLSLHLPNLTENIFVNKLTLNHLLDKFVATEIVKDVSCEKCNKQQKGTNAIKVNAMKTLKFGKLPRCLCFHIQRTIWQRSGQAYKRYDYIEFPEYLSMDDYTFIQAQKLKVLLQDGLNCDQSENKSLQGSFRIKHLYKLSAVVVHVGSMESGHFVTFRRAPLREHKWYYTSDCEVRESSLQEAMQACAYMLFYNKFTSSISNGVRPSACDSIVL